MKGQRALQCYEWDGALWQIHPTGHFQSQSLFCFQPLKSTGHQCQQGIHFNTVNITPHKCFKPGGGKIYSKYYMLCSGTYLIKPVRRIHCINPVFSRKVPTSSLITFPTNHPEIKKRREQHNFTIREQSWNYMWECLCVSVGETKEGRAGFTTPSCCNLPFNKLLVLIPSEVNWTTAIVLNN